jgi:hypothetical protein
VADSVVTRCPVSDPQIPRPRPPGREHRGSSKCSNLKAAHLMKMPWAGRKSDMRHFAIYIGESVSLLKDIRGETSALCKSDTSSVPVVHRAGDNPEPRGAGVAEIRGLAAPG